MTETPAPNNPPYAPQGNGMAVAGFVLSLCAYPLFFLVVPWILAVVFSGIGLYRSQFLPGGHGKGLAIAGLALSLGPAALLFMFGIIGSFAS